MLFPAKEWKQIVAEDNNRKAVFMKFVLPLLCLIAIATIIGTWFYSSRDFYSAIYVLRKITIILASLIAGLYASAFVITEIMANQVGSRNHHRAFALLAYSSGAAYLVIAVVALFPILIELLVLMFYACYLYWQGIPHLIQIEGQKHLIYSLISFIVVVLVHYIMFFFFGNVLEAILV